MEGAGVNPTALFPALPPGEVLTAADDEIAVRLAVPADAEALYELLTLEETRNPAGSPSAPAQVAAWIGDEHGERTRQPNQGPDLIWVIEREGVIVGSVVTALCIDRSSGESPIRSVEYYDMERHPSLRGMRIAQRTVRLLEPLLVQFFDVQQVTATVVKGSRERSGLVAATMFGFGNPESELADRYNFRRAAVPKTPS